MLSVPWPKSGAGAESISPKRGTIVYLTGFFQNAYVTRNLEHAVALMTKRHGLSNWVYFEPKMEVYTAVAGHGPCHVKVGLAWTGSLQVEVIEPVSGNLQHYLDYLPPS